MSKKQRRVFWSSLVVIGLTLITIGLVLGRGNGSTTTKPGGLERGDKLTRVTDMTSPPPQTSRERIEVEPVTLRARGFEPSAITRPRGQFLLAVDNRSGFPDLDFRLVGLNGNQQAAKRMRGRELRWRQLVDLPPGDYVLTEANHPRWHCQISITPH
jgi:hypothetical protein